MTTKDIVLASLLSNPSFCDLLELSALNQNNKNAHPVGAWRHPNCASAADPCIITRENGRRLEELKQHQAVALLPNWAIDILLTPPRTDAAPTIE